MNNFSFLQQLLKYIQYNYILLFDIFNSIKYLIDSREIDYRMH